jgi:hypothetical protein
VSKWKDIEDAPTLSEFVAEANEQLNKHTEALLLAPLKAAPEFKDAPIVNNELKKWEKPKKAKAKKETTQTQPAMFEDKVVEGIKEKVDTKTAFLTAGPHSNYWLTHTYSAGPVNPTNHLPAFTKTPASVVNTPEGQAIVLQDYVSNRYYVVPVLGAYAFTDSYFANTKPDPYYIEHAVVNVLYMIKERIVKALMGGK